jgi:hypothetical protein
MDCALFQLKFVFEGSKSTGIDEEDGAGVIEFENALNFWREYKVESELQEKEPEKVASLDTFKRALRPFVKDKKIRFTGCKGDFQSILTLHSFANEQKTFTLCLKAILRDVTYAIMASIF